jgi:hypothetical protein
VIGKYKKFDQADYDKFDGPAKEALRTHLELTGHRVTVPDENYGVDLYSEWYTARMYHEVEVSHGWKINEHPFGLGSVPERKLRLARIHINDALFFWMLRRDLARALVFPACRLTPEFLVEVANVKIKKGEYFYRIPKKYGKEFDLLCR